MTSFLYFSVISVSVFLIVIFIFMALLTYGTKSTFTPLVSNCPDYWFDSYDPTNADPTKTPSGTCYNEMSLGESGCSKTMDFSKMNVCEKQRWAKNCNIMWDGITDAKLKCPVEYDFTGTWSGAGTFKYGPNNTAVFNWFPEMKRKNPVNGVRKGVNTWEFDFTDAGKLTGIILNQNRIHWGGDNIWDREIVAAVKDFVIGQSTRCSEGDFFKKGSGAVYRYMGNNTLNYYPTPAIASSWDSTWGTPKDINCTGLRRGPNVTMKESPFMIGSPQSTPWNTEADGNIIYLDRHGVSCNANALNQLNLKRKGDAQGNPDGNFRYDFTCTSGGALGPSQNKTTPLNDLGNGSAVYLDRHDVKCGDNEVLTGLKLVTNGGKIQYQYKCAPSSAKLTCRQDNTQFDAEGDGRSVFLDRHNVKCKPNEALSRLHLARKGDGNFRYEYTCCSSA